MQSVKFGQLSLLAAGASKSKPQLMLAAIVGSRGLKIKIAAGQNPPDLGEAVVAGSRGPDLREAVVIGSRGPQNNFPGSLVHSLAGVADGSRNPRPGRALWGVRIGNGSQSVDG